MAENQNTRLIENIQRLLTPKPHLNPYLFDSNGQMSEDVHRRLLQKIDAVYECTLSCFAGVQLEEVFLCGSSASYLWKDDSDFDIWLKIAIDSDKFFISKSEKARNFFNRYLKAKNQRQLLLDNHFLDIKISTSELGQMHGAYSITKNCWLIAPSQDLTAGLDSQELYDTVMLRKTEVEQLMNEFTSENVKNMDMEELKKLPNYYDRMVDRQYQNTFEYIILKLLRYEKTTVELQNFCIDKLAEHFSFCQKNN